MYIFIKTRYIDLKKILRDKISKLSLTIFKIQKRLCFKNIFKNILSCNTENTDLNDYDITENVETCLTNNEEVDDEEEEDNDDDDDSSNDHAQFVFSMNDQQQQQQQHRHNHNNTNSHTESLLAISSSNQTTIGPSINNHNLMTSSSNSVLTSMSSSSNNTALSNSNTINSSLYSNGSLNGAYYHPDFNQNNHQTQIFHINESTNQNQQQQQQQFVNFTQPIEEWSSELVAQWLAINDLSQYVDAFLAKLVNGEKLTLMDSTKLKALGVKSQKDRDFIKSKVKELKADEKKRFKLLLEQQQQQLSAKKKKIKN